MIFLKILTVIILPFLAFGACWLGGTLGLYMARRNKKTGCKTPEFRKKTPPPPPTTGSNAQIKFYCNGKKNFCTTEQKMRDYCNGCCYLDGSGGKWIAEGEE